MRHGFELFLVMLGSFGGLASCAVANDTPRRSSSDPSSPTSAELPATARRAPDPPAAPTPLPDAVAATSPATSTAPPASSCGPPDNRDTVIRRLKGKFRACYHVGLARNPNLGGWVTLVLTIGPQGEVQAVSAEVGPMTPIVECLKSVLLTGTAPGVRDHDPPAFTPQDCTTTLSLPVQFGKFSGAPFVELPVRDF